MWDGAVPGFGARRQRTNAISNMDIYRTSDGRQRWLTIGRHGAPWTPEKAREEARRLLGEVAGGADPATKKSSKRAAAGQWTIDLYLADAMAGRLLTRRKAQAGTLATDIGRQAYIKPLLGALPVSAVTQNDIEKFMHGVAEGKTAGLTKTDKKRGLARVRGGRGTASRTVGLLGSVPPLTVRGCGPLLTDLSRKIIHACRRQA